ncbi:MAG: hypothetical protein RL266_1453 [Bacteroidota bacterium]
MLRILLLFVVASSSAFAQDGAMEGIDVFFADEGFYDNVADAAENADSVLYLDLSLQSPKLTSIPAGVFLFVNLKYLELGFNQIASINPQISKLENLEVLGLSGNKYLKSIAEEVFLLPKLKELHLKDTGLSASDLDAIRSKLPSNCKLIR